MVKIGKTIISKRYLEPLRAKQKKNNVNRYSGAEMSEISFIISTIDEAFKMFPEQSKLGFPDQFINRIRKALAIKPAKRSMTPQYATKKIDALKVRVRKLEGK